MVAILYGVFAYLTFLGTFLYAMGFVANVGVPKSIDSGPVGPVALAFLIDLALLTGFAIQHSIMARQGFKRWVTSVIPRETERSTYVLASCACLILLFWQWRPLPSVLWDVPDPQYRMFVHGVSAVGWLMVLSSSFLINHFDLFGLRQVWLKGSYEPVPFAAPFLYRVVRHPLMLGFLIAFWAAPTMTVGHLVFSAACTGYICVGVLLEERDLMTFHGERYRLYKEQVPMLLPLPRRR
jgi:protein-S-isoprenylcysteine O-methyltransferase Ste14